MTNEAALKKAREIVKEWNDMFDADDNGQLITDIAQAFAEYEQKLEAVHKIFEEIVNGLAITSYAVIQLRDKLTND